jgi:sugar O-acyltransferase (sialic acid O-acetyltransferase NeuD family)
MPLARQQATGDVELVFVETHPTSSTVNGVRVLSDEDFFSIDCSQRLFNVAIADSRTRERLAARCLERGAHPWSIHAPDVVIYDNNEISEGSILCAGSIVTSNTKVGRFFHANLGSYVAHDCVIGDFVTFAPRVHCNGNVRIGDHAYVGTGAIIKQGSPDRPLIVGERSVIGMGAVVTKDVPDGTTVVGNPARPMGTKR